MPRIIVLDDGETWSGGGFVVTVTEEQLERLQWGEEPKDLDLPDEDWVEIKPKKVVQAACDHDWSQRVRSRVCTKCGKEIDDYD